MINLGSNVMGIGLSVALRDQFTNKAKQVAGSMGMMTKQANMMRSSLEGARLMGFGLAASGLLVANSYRKAVMVSMDFHAIMKGTQAVTGATNDQLLGLEGVALAVSKSTIFTARQVASAMEYLGKAGFTPGQISGTIDAVTALGAATGTKIEGKGGAADMMTNMMTAFNLKVSQSGRAADILAKVASKANLDVGDLEQSMKYLGSAAQAVKMPFEDAAAVTSVLANAGIRGGMAGRGLANVLFFLSKAATDLRTPKQANVLKRLGIDPAQLKTAQGELRPMMEILDVFKNSMNQLELPGPDKIALIQQLFNIRGARALLPLFDDKHLGLNFADMLDTLQNKSQGAAEEMAKIRLDNLQGDITILQSVWEAFKIAQGDALTGPLRFIVKTFTKIVRVMTTIAEHPLGKAMLIIGAGLSVAAVALGAFMVLFSTFGLMLTTSRPAIAMMKGALVSTWNTATAAVARYIAVAQGATFTGKGGMAVKGMKGFQTVSKGTKGMMLGNWISNALGRPGLPGVGGGATGKVGKGFLQVLSKSTGILGNFGGILRLLVAPLSLLTIAISSIFGFTNMIKGVVYGLGTFFQALMFGVDYLGGLFMGDFNGVIAKQKFRNRQAKMVGALGFDPDGGMMGWGKAPAKTADAIKNRRASELQLLQQVIDTKYPTGKEALKSPNVSVNIDGREVANAVSNVTRDNMAEYFNTANQ